MTEFIIYSEAVHIYSSVGTDLSDSHYIASKSAGGSVVEELKKVYFLSFFAARF